MVYQEIHIAEHHRLTKHKIDWDSVEYVTYSTNTQERLTLESWYANLEQEPLNRSQLPAPYKRLVHDVKRNRQNFKNNRRTKSNNKTTTLRTKLTNQNQDHSHEYHHLMKIILDSEDDYCSDGQNFNQQQQSF